MAHAAHRSVPSSHAWRLEAEKALRAAQTRNLRARAALAASTGAGAVARRMVVELTQREVQKAGAAVIAAAEAATEADSRQLPLSAWTRAVVARRAEAARTAGNDRLPSAASAEPLLAWARSHG
jgi:hypothetical protein